MTKRLFLFMGLLIGFLLAEIVRRPKLQRLAIFDAQASREKERYAEYERQWQEEVATLPFDERMEYELWEAKMRLDHWIPDLSEEDDDAET